MAGPFQRLVTNPPKTAAPATPIPRPRPNGQPQAEDPDALYHRLVTAAATSHDRAGFLRDHQHDLARLKPAVRQVVVQAAGLGAPAETVAKALSPRSYANTQITKAAHDVAGIPGGVVQTAGAVVGDVKDTVHGHPTLKRTVGAGKQIVKGVVQTVEHPGRDLFQTGTLIGAALTGGAGAAARVGAIKAAVTEAPAADLATAVGKLSKHESHAYGALADPKQLAQVDEATARLIANPSPRLTTVLGHDPHLAAVRTETVKALADGKLVPRPLTTAEKPAAAARAVGTSKPAQVVKAAVKTPTPKQRTLTVPAADGNPAFTVHPLPSKNPLANVVERQVIDRYRQKKLDAGKEPAEAGRVVGVIQKHASTQSTVGRELRAARTVRDALELAPVSRLERFAPSAPARGLTRATGGRVNVRTVLPVGRGAKLTAAEQKAIDIKAAFSTPEDTVRYHENLLDQGVGKAADHRTQIALARAAAPHFEAMAAGTAPKLVEAAGETRAVIQKAEQLKGLTPEEIAHRVGARVADRAAVAAGNESPLQEIDRLQKQVETTDTSTPAHEAAANRLAAVHEDITRHGFHAIENGAFYLPARDRALTKSKVPATKAPTEYGLGPPGTAPWLGHAYTGALERSGRARSDATRLASESYKQAQRFSTIDRGYRQVLAAARPTKEEAGGERFAVPIRTTVSVPDWFKRLVNRQELGTISKEEAKRLHQAGAEALARAFFPEKDTVDALPPEERAKIKWVDERYLGGLIGQGANLGKKDRGGAALDAINAPFRAALLYTKPSYGLNLVQALGTNVIQQGVFTPVNIARALRLGKDLGAEDQHAIFSLVGQGLSRSLEGGGPLGLDKAIHGAGELWNTVIDRYPRVAAFLHEARREGFNTPEKLHALLNDPRFEAKLVDVTRRGNREAIEYGNLSPFEQNVARRALFFYPWLRGATLYSLRYGREHPIQAAVAAQLGGEGHDAAVKAFGPFVDYAPGGEGLVPFSGGRGANLSNLNTFQTPVDIAQAVIGLGQPRSLHANDLTQELGPAAAAAYTLLSGKTTSGYDLPQSTSRAGGAAKQLEGLIPFVQGINRANPPAASANPAKQPIFPKGPRAAIERGVGGSAFPQKINQAALTAKGEKAYKTTLDPVEKARYGAASALDQARRDAKLLYERKVLPSPTLPPVVQKALSLDRERKIGYAQAAKDNGVSVANLSALQKAAVVADIVARRNLAKPAAIQTLVRLVTNEPDPKRKAQIVSRFWHEYGRGGALSAWRHYTTRARSAVAARP